MPCWSNPNRQHNKEGLLEREPFLFVLNPGFLDDADDQGNKVDDQAVKGSDHGHFQTSAEDGRTDVTDHLDGVQYLEQAQ